MTFVGTDRVAWIDNPVTVVGDYCGLSRRGRHVGRDRVGLQERDPLAECGLSEEAVGILDLLDAFVYLYDMSGTTLWANRAGRRLVGCPLEELRGRHFTEFLAEADAEVAEVHFGRTIQGLDSVAEYTADFVDRDGGCVTVKTFCLPLMRGRQIIGLMRLCVPTDVARRDDMATRHWPSLTPRQSEVLELLCAGLSTREIALRLVISYETARNHISGVLRALGARSQTEAVVIARRDGLLGPTGSS